MSLGVIEVGLAVSALGCGGPRPEPPDATSANLGGNEMTGVTGIGGIFFKSDDPAMTLEWYRTHLGIEYNDWGGFPFQWREPTRLTTTERLPIQLMINGCLCNLRIDLCLKRASN